MRKLFEVAFVQRNFQDDYKSMVDCQKPQARLSEKTFGSIQDLREIRSKNLTITGEVVCFEDFLGAKRMTSHQLTAALIILALRRGPRHC